MKRKLLEGKVITDAKRDENYGVLCKDVLFRIFVNEWRDVQSLHGREVLKREVLKQFEEEVLNKLLF